jgi:hypothetical protein
VVSCFGAEARVKINRDGSGQLKLNYRLNKQAEQLGTLDGNASFPIVPVGEADFRRTCERIGGLTLKSFKRTEDSRDYIYNIQLNFSRLESFLAFMGTGGVKTTNSRNKGSTTATMTFNAPAGNVPSYMAGLVQTIFQGYTVNFNLELPAGGSAAITKTDGTPLTAIPGGTVSSAGGKLSLNAPAAWFFDPTSSFTIKFGWKN